ncbi:MAG: diaminopimelate epimerase [Chlamydiae bacterium]|nr:diaminopimelate epimerase [Chlamydiota bacterium]
MIQFYKYQAFGNDFILIDDQKLKLTKEDIKRLCDRKFGIGADGIVLLLPSLKADFKMQIFNSDGSEAEMCGNGLSCLIKFIKDLKLFTKTNFFIETLAGVMSVGCLGEKIFFLSKYPTILAQDVELNFLDKKVMFDFVDSGVPHSIIFTSDVDKIDIDIEGLKIQNHDYFKPKGVNVNFVSIEKDKIKVRTFERGVQKETLACGTGALAVSAILYEKYHLKNPIILSFPGGEIETIVDPNKKNIQYLGTSTLVFKGECSSSKN